jgi:hypothetical protein
MKYINTKIEASLTQDVSKKTTKVHNNVLTQKEQKTELANAQTSERERQIAMNP